MHPDTATFNSNAFTCQSREEKYKNNQITISQQRRQVLALLKWTYLSAATDIPETAAISAVSFSSICPYNSEHMMTAQKHVSSQLTFSYLEKCTIKMLKTKNS